MSSSITNSNSSSLKQLQKMLQRARTLHGQLSDQLVNTLGLDAADVKARYGHFTDADGSTAQRRLRNRHPEPMTNAPITSSEKRKIRLLLRALKSSVINNNFDHQQQQHQESGDDYDDDDDEEVSSDDEDAEEKEPNVVTMKDLRGTSRQSFALFEKLILRSASDVADLTSSDDDDGCSSASDNFSDDDDDVDDDEEVEQDSNDDHDVANENTTRKSTSTTSTNSVQVQTTESSMSTIKLAERLLTGDSDGCQGGLKSRRFPHWIPQPPYASPFLLSNNNNNNSSSSTPFMMTNLIRTNQTVFAGQPYLAMVFRPQSMKMLQSSNFSNNNNGGYGSGKDQQDNDEGAGGWTPTFFPVEIQFVPKHSSSVSSHHHHHHHNEPTQQDFTSSSGGQQQSSGSQQQTQQTQGGSLDLEGGARLVIRRIPITRDGQRFAISRADAAGSVITDVGCSALRSVVVGQTSRYFLRGRMVLQKKAEWAKKWEWKVPNSVLQQQQQQQSNYNSNSNNKIPNAIDFTTIPTMAQMSDRSVSLSFVDATVLNFPAKSTDVEEDTALQAAATRMFNNNSDNLNNNNNNNNNGDPSTEADGGGPLPNHVNTSPPNFVPTAGAELALVFPSHAEFNTFLAEAMYWCADYAAFRYGRPADFHSPDVLRNLSAPVRDLWQSLDGEELTFCEEFHIPPSVYLTARRRVTASSDPTKSMTSIDGLLCEEDLSVICDVDYLQLSAMIRFLQARGFVKLHSLYHVRKPM